jgi:hypothetical protein
MTGLLSPVFLFFTRNLPANGGGVRKKKKDEKSKGTRTRTWRVEG